MNGAPEVPQIPDGITLESLQAFQAQLEMRHAEVRAKIGEVQARRAAMESSSSSGRFVDPFSSVDL